MDEFGFVSEDGTRIHVYHWPICQPTGVVQVAHGAAEHGRRYARVAAALNNANYDVYAIDHRGHGKSALPGKLGIFAAEDGWNRAVADLAKLNEIIADRLPGLPIMLLGHSMGSWLAQQYLVEYGETIAALTLSGSAMVGGFSELLPGLEAEAKEHGRESPSALMSEIMTSGLNVDIRVPATPFDWLSRDPDEVQKYIDDPLCGFDLSIGAWTDMFGKNRIPATTAELARAPKAIPIYVFSGDRDPASNNTENLWPLLELYSAAGMTRVSYRFYEGGRHEPLNDTNRDEVTADLIAWLSDALA